MSHYYDATPTSASDPRDTELQIEGRTFRFTTDHGVFSRGHVDTGSLTLLEAAIPDLRDPVSPLPQPLRLLDLACGYGVLGIVLKRCFPAFMLAMTDVNERAISLSSQNLSENQITSAELVQADGFTGWSPEPFSVIVCNPPIRTGKPTVQRLLLEASDHLMPGGILYSVFGKKQGAESYGRFLAEHFQSNTRIAREQGFFVYRSIKKG